MLVHTTQVNVLRAPAGLRIALKATDIDGDGGCAVCATPDPLHDEGRERELLLTRFLIVRGEFYLLVFFPLSMV